MFGRRDETVEVEGPAEGIAYNIPLNSREQEYEFKYLVTPRPNPAFKSVVDPYSLLIGSTTPPRPMHSWASKPPGSVFGVKMWSEADLHGPKVVFRSSMELPQGAYWELCTFRVNRQNLLVPDALERQAWVTGDTVVREERALFGRGPAPLPECMYPDTLLPFLLARAYVGTPSSSTVKKPVFAWCGDRFVTKMVLETKRGNVNVTVPAGNFPCIETSLYPDMGEFGIGRWLVSLAKPFVPCYRAWIAMQPPHPLVRFEGGLGPPGSPEVVFELTDVIPPQPGGRRASVTGLQPVGVQPGRQYTTVRR